MSFTSRWSDVYLASAARGVSACGDFLAVTALTLAFQEAGASGTSISALLLAASLPVVVLAPVAGRIADRADSRRALVITGAVQTAVCLVLAATRQPMAIVILVAVLAGGLALTQPILTALVTDMVRPHDLARASSINQTAAMLGMLIAPALAGILVGQFGTHMPLLLNAVSYLALVAAGVLLRTRRNARTSPPPSAPAAPSAPADAGSWRLRGDRLLTVTIVAVAAVVGTVAAINVIDVFFIRETLHASPTAYGLINASWAAGMLIGAILSSRTGRYAGNPTRLVQGVLVLLAGACAVVTVSAAARSMLPLLPLWLVGGACNGGLNVFITIVIASRAPSRTRGHAYAALNAAVQGTSVAGLLLGGVLVDHFAPRMLMAAIGATGLVVTALCASAAWGTLRHEATTTASTTAALDQAPAAHHT